jgi:hypothetical protein
VTGYLLERCSGSGCTTFTLIGSPTGTTYSDTGLTPSRSYSYRLRATDAAGNVSGYSSTATTATSTTTSSSIAYVQSQSASPDNSSLATLSATFSSAQTAGNFNVVAVGWGSSTAIGISSVTDSKGNTYALAVGPTYVSGVGSAAIYYAKSIAASAAGGNTVTVTWASAVGFPDIRMAEYRGISTTSPLDVTAVANGTSTLSNSGSATTTNANDLLVGSNWFTLGTTSAGTGYTQRQISGWDGDILEDQIVSTVGAYSATAPITTSSPWIMQMAAFKGAGSGDTTPPSAPTALVSPANSDSQINLSWTKSTDNVGVTSYLIERCLTSACTFAQIGTTPTATYFDTSVSATTSYNYRVRATDASSNLSGYSNTVTASAAAAAAYQCVSSGAPTVCYFYDEAGRLRVAKYDDGAQQNYVLDSAGNRLLSVSATAPPLGKPVVTVAPRTATSLTIAWTVPTGGNAQFTYVVQRGSTTISCTTSPCIDTGLTVNTQYSYVVTATDSDGNTVQSNLASGTTYSNPPITFTAATTSATSIVLTWSSTGTGGPSGTLTYSLRRGATTLACTSSPCTDSGLMPATTYNHSLTATNSVGDSTSAIATAQTYPIPSITSFTAAAPTSTTVNLSWSATDSGGPNSGALQYSVTNSTLNRAVPNCTGVSTTSCTDTGLLAFTAYSYVLTAVDAAGDSKTATASASTPKDVTLQNGSYSCLCNTAHFTLSADTYVYATALNVTVLQYYQWTTAAPANFQALVTVTSGSIGGTTGSWVSLASDQSWSVGSDSTATFTIQIRRASDGVVEGTATVTLTATPAHGRYLRKDAERSYALMRNRAPRRRYSGKGVARLYG